MQTTKTIFTIGIESSRVIKSDYVVSASSQEFITSLVPLNTSGCVIDSLATSKQRVSRDLILDWLLPEVGLALVCQ